MVPTPSPSLSSSAGIPHPVYLPQMNPPRGRGAKGAVVALAAVAAVGYGIAAYRQALAEKGQSVQAAAAQAELDRKRQNSVLMDAYGDRGSLEELENAIRVYEAQRGGK